LKNEKKKKKAIQSNRLAITASFKKQPQPIDEEVINIDQ